MLRLLAFLALLWAAPALAQQTCIASDYTWTTAYSQGSIQAVSYSLDTLVLQVTFLTQDIHAFQAVPRSVAQNFVGLQNADTYYNQAVATRYHQALLSEYNATGPCPLLNEDGSTWLLGS